LTAVSPIDCEAYKNQRMTEITWKNHSLLYTSYVWNMALKISLFS